MAVQIRKAERAKSKLRVGLSGPSGSGKTYSALLMAFGLVGSWEKIVLIDTENGSGELYSNLGPYNVITLSAPFSPESYIEAIEAAQAAGMEAIVIDSVSHEWDGKGGCLQINEMLANAKYKGNTWAAWSEVTPRHQKFIEAITTASCHVITTARSKTDTIQTEDKKIKKVGLKDIQREGFEYELTVAFNIDRDEHLAIASKDRTELFIDRDPFIVTSATGEELLAWAQSGRDVPVDVAKEKGRIMFHFKRLGLEKPSSAERAAEMVAALVELDVTDESMLPQVVKKLEAFTAEGAQAVLAEHDAKKHQGAETKAPPAAAAEHYPDEVPGS